MPPRSAWSDLQVARSADTSYVDEYGITSIGLQVYSQGECWYLAWVLHQLTGFDLVAVATADSDLEDLFWAHVLIRLPDGRLIDALGIHTDTDVLALWSRYHRCTMRLVSLGSLDADDYSALLEHDVQAVPARFSALTQDVAHYILHQVGVTLVRTQKTASV